MVLGVTGGSEMSAPVYQVPMGLLLVTVAVQSH